MNDYSLMGEVWRSEEEWLILLCSYVMILCGTVTVLILSCTTWKASYGRYSHTAAFTKLMVPARVAWFVQELPSFVVPILVICVSKCDRVDLWPNRLVLAMYLLHYFQRSVIYPFLINGGKSTPVHIFAMAFGFCCYNGYIQGSYHAKYAYYDSQQFFSSFQVYFGLVLFCVGMFINLHSDRILRNLRKPGETAYKIPEGGVFSVVSGANFLGEIIEWIGYAVVSGTVPACAFAYFTVCNIGPRALAHHMYGLSVCLLHAVCNRFLAIMGLNTKNKFYIEKFEDYPTHRKALIPYIF